MTTTTILLISIWLSISLVMGLFAISQRAYQHRMRPLEEGGKCLVSFVEGFISWPVLFPLGIAKSKYKCNTLHKGSTRQPVAPKR